MPSISQLLQLTLFVRQGTAGRRNSPSLVAGAKLREWAPNGLRRRLDPHLRLVEPFEPTHARIRTEQVKTRGPVHHLRGACDRRCGIIALGRAPGGAPPRGFPGVLTPFDLGTHAREHAAPARTCMRKFSA